jgi:tRNA (guanine-N7-)-methyltransferase
LIKDFGQNIDKIFAENEISESYIFFPDPWGKKNSQKKNRLLQADFLTHLYTVTQDGGKLYFKTDHREYFESVLAIIEKL